MKRKIFLILSVVAVLLAVIMLPTFAEDELPEVESVTFEEYKVYEHIDGYYTKGYNSNSQYVDYFKYYINTLEFTVTLKNGDVIQSDYERITYNGKYYYLDYNNPQSAKNPWGVGKNYVSATIMGFETQFCVEVVENPFSHIVFGEKKLIQNYDGYYANSYNPEMMYFHYNNLNPPFTVYLKNGTSIESDGQSVEYNGKTFSISVSSDQSYENQWGLGKHTVTDDILGLECTFEVEVVESPVTGVTFDDVVLYNKIGGSKSGEYVEGEYKEYYRYNYDIPPFTVYLSDGTSINSESVTMYYETSYGVYYNGKFASLEHTDPQSYSNQWSMGDHTVEASILGYSTSFKVKIVESPYVKLEAIYVGTVKNGNYSYTTDGGVDIYSIPAFTYKVTDKDGGVVYGFSGDGKISTSHSQSKTPWTADGKNTFTIYFGELSAEVEVTVTADTGADNFKYTEQDGKVYITGTKHSFSAEKIDVPAEIDEKPVAGIMSLEGTYESYNVCEINIPDSVEYVADGVFRDFMYIEKVSFGKGVKKISQDMFDHFYLENIYVSDEQSDYSCVDGVIYNKAKDTVVAFPTGRNEFTVPASVKELGGLIDLDVALTVEEGSAYYKTVDGVTYSADMKKVICCDKSVSGEYVMPDSVVYIAENAFANSSFSKIVVSKNVTDIAYRAFAGSSVLNVELPAGLKSISDQAFRDSGLVKIEIPDGVTKIEEKVFCDCTNLKEVKLSANLEAIENSAFGRTGIKEIVFPEGLKNIGEAAFNQCNELKKVILPDSLTQLGDSAFYYCSSLEEVKLSKGLTVIPECTFAYTGIKEITVPSSITLLEKYAFVGCKELESVNIEGSAEIEEGVFDRCRKLSTLKADKITYIGMNAFNSSALTEYKASNTVTEIAYQGFYGSENLADIDIPDTLKAIGGKAFEETKWYDNQAEGIVYLEHVALGYKAGNGYPETLEIKAGTTSVAGYAFSDISGVKSIKLPEGLEYIGFAAFANMGNIEEINIPASVTFIERFAFEMCSSLKAINVSPDNKYYTSVDGVLYNKDCTELIKVPNIGQKTYTVPSTVKKIHNYAFSYSGVEIVDITSNSTELMPYSVGYTLRRIKNAADSSQDAYKKFVLVVCAEGSKAHETVVSKNGLWGLEVKPYTVGDVDGNNVIDSDDAIHLLYHILFGEEGYPISQPVDYDKNGRTDSDDAIYLLYHILFGAENYPL